MYYYAYINESNICTGVYAMPSELNVAGYIAITEAQYNSQSVVGMYFNEETGNWEAPVTWYYAVLNERDIVTSVVDAGQETIADNYIRIDTLDQSLVGMVYDRTTQQFRAATFKDMAAHSTDEINVGDTDESLTARIGNTYTKGEVDTMLSDVTGGTGTPGEDGGYYTPAVAADGTLTWTASKEGMPAVGSANIKGADGQDGAAGADGQDGQDGTTVVVGTVTTGEAGTSAVVQGVLNEETNTLTLNFTIPRGAQGEQGEQGEKGDAGDDATIDAYTKTETDNLLADKADSTHSHDYAPSTHTHSTGDIIGLSSALSGKADASHTHSEYASSSHSHSGTYAAYSHTHSGYFSTSGGTITGETNFSGGLVRTKGTQTLYNSGSMITFSSNNVQTMIAGSAIFSKVAISVSSDERLKENIADVDAQACIDFIKCLDVKTFNYIDNTEPCIGVIAQDIEGNALAKYLVRTTPDGYKSVKITDIVFPLIVAVQALQG